FAISSKISVICGCVKFMFFNFYIVNTKIVNFGFYTLFLTVSFVHRIGRTGRADNPGAAISLLTFDDLHHFNVIQKKIKKRVDIIETDNYKLF
ncbi:MAG: hypothetical protein KBE91_03230, partial [Bacteroidia bacterium]|nr:hypothetical protein [Bacteroidia bacterium]